MDKLLKRLGWGGTVLSILITAFSRYLDYKDAEALGLSESTWLTIGLGVFFVSVIALFLWWQKLANQKIDAKNGSESETSQYTIEFYRTRQELISTRGTLPDELGDTKVQKVWVAWWSGASPRTQGVFDKANIDRTPPINKMILIDPQGDYINSHAIIDNKTVEYIRNDIELTVNTARPRGVDVKFFDGAIEGMIIADKVNYAKEYDFSDDAWIRVEVSIPYKDHINPCNFIVKKRYDQLLFDALIEHYKFIWELSNPEPTSISPPSEAVPKIIESIPVWLQYNLAKDRQELADCILILNRNWTFNLETTEPFVELELVIKNTAIFPISIINVKGHFLIDGAKCNSSIMIEKEEKVFHRALWMLKIKQAISEQTANKIIAIRDSKKKLRINLVECRLIIKSGEPEYDLQPVEVHIGQEFELDIIKL